MRSRAPANRSPLTFIALVFLLSVPFWLIEPVAGDLSLAVPMQLPVSALQFVCPLIAVLIMLRRSGPGNIKRLMHEIFDVHKIDRRRWLVPVFLLMPFVMVMSYALMVLSGRTVPEPKLQVLVVPIISVLFFLTALSEEVGWMGYAADPLQRRWSAFMTALTLGVVWAVWHLIPYIQANHAPSWVIWQCIATVALRVLIFWVYNNTGGSLFAVILFHTGINVNNALFPDNGSFYDPVVTGFLLLIAATVVTYLWGTSTLADYRYAPATGESQPTTG